MTTKKARARDTRAPLISSKPPGPSSRQSKFELVSMVFGAKRSGENTEFAEWLIFERSRKPHPTSYDVLMRVLWTEFGIDVSTETLKGWCRDINHQMQEYQALLDERQRLADGAPANVASRPPYED